MVDRPEVSLDELYREVVMDHHRRPRGRAPLGRVDATAHGFNPMCGDEVQLNLALADGRVSGVELQGRGCAICTASGSILAEMLPGLAPEQAEATGEAFRSMLQGKPVPADIDLGDLEALEGVKRFAVRVKCAMLPWVTLSDALRAWRKGERAATTTTERDEETR